MPSVLCVYILPGADTERASVFRERAEEFACSYIAHPPGAGAELQVVVKGDFHGHGLEQFFDRPSFASTPTFVSHPNVGYDVASWLRVAGERSDVDWLMCFGAYARLLHDGWLAMMLEHAGADTGVLGTTASFEAGVTRLPRNPHIRTSAFLIRRETLLSLRVGDVVDKNVCYEFEHGHGSMYRQLRERGLDCPIIGADGNAYDEEHWADSFSFRRGDQHNALVADHHSDHFAKAPPDEREALARAAGWDPE